MNTRITNFTSRNLVLRPTLDTSPYAAGDVLFNSTELVVSPLSSRVSGTIKGISVLDKDDVGAAIDLWFLRSNVVFGAANAAPSITDAAAEAVLKYVSLTPDKDLGVCKFGQVACAISFDIDSPKMYIAAVTQGTPTYTAAGLVITVDIELEVG